MADSLGRKSIQSNVAWNSIGSLVYFGFQWLITISVVRISDSYDAAGLLGYAMTIANLFTPFALFRMRTYQVSDVNNVFSTSDYLGFRITTCLVAYVFCMVYSLFTCPTFAVPAISLYLIFKSVEQLIDVLAGLEQKNMRLDYAGKSLISRGFLTFLSFTAVLFISQSIELSIASMIASTLLVAVVYDFPTAAAFDNLKPRFNVDHFRFLFTECFLVVISSVAFGMTMSVPKQYLGAIDGTSLLGIYSSISAPVAIVQLAASYVYSPLLGLFAGRYNDNDLSGLVRLLVKSALSIIGLGIIAIIALGCFGPDILVLLFGHDMSIYAYTLIPMVICSLATGFALFMADVLLSIREFRWNALSGFAALFISIAATVPFVQCFSLNGVSLAGMLGYLISISIAIVGLILKIKRHQDR